MTTNEQPSITKIGLVLTGGGARAAYQVGVLRAVADIIRPEKNPFLIISGFSAGAINGTWLASRCESFDRATQSMWDAWASITADKIFNTGTSSLVNIALRWIKDRGLGGLRKSTQINYLLDTAPLDKFIRSHINFDILNRHLETNKLCGVSVTAVDYRTGNSTIFYYGNEKIKDWKKFNRVSVRTKIKPEYVLASSAIPIFFPPVCIAESCYGDGMIRMQAPLSPAIHMGAEKIFVIGSAHRSRLTQSPDKKQFNSVTVSEIAGTIFNGLFLDSLDADIDRLQRVNRTLSVMTEDRIQQLPDRLRKIPILNLRPSEDLAGLSMIGDSKLPAAMNYFLRGIGVAGNKGVDLLSFLSFEPKYLRSLLELGYEDTVRIKNEVQDFFDTAIDE